MEYIILDGKTPTHGFKNGQGAKTWKEVKEFDNVAMIVPEGYIVLDFDTSADARIMLEIINGLDLKCRVMKTTRGIHCWFRSSEPSPKNFIKQRLAVGIYADRKAGGRNSYVKIKQDGKMREWIRKIPQDEIEVVPSYFLPVSAPVGKFAFKGMTDGSGRNQELFNYIVYLQSKGMNRDEIRKTISVINDYVFLDPLSESEISTICRDEAFKPDDVISAQIAESQKKTPHLHVLVAEEIIAAHNLFSYNGVIYEYADGYYQPADFLRKYARETYDGARNAQVNEIVQYIMDMKKVRNGGIKVNPYILNLKNTRLDIRTSKTLEFSPDAIEFERIDVTYDPAAYSADLDKMLSRVFCRDQDVRLLFEEMLGYILIKHARYQKAFLFYGGGSNGKSTILNMIKTFLGQANYTAIPLEEVTGRFNKAELEHKLANIGDDIDKTTIKDTGTLKKLFSGNAVLVERKGERPYVIEPYATHIYSCNTIPRSFDKSEGFYRRWIFIPFHAQFTADDADFDPLIEDKITTPEALSYLLNLGIRGAQRLIKQGQFTEPQSVKDALERYKTDNSTVLSWIEDDNISESHILSNSRDFLYSEFADWCKISGIKSDMITGKKAFYREVIQKFDLDERCTQNYTDGKRYFTAKNP